MSSLRSAWYFERLSLYVVFIQLLPQVFFNRQKPQAVFYIDSEIFAVKLASFFLNFFRIPCLRLDFKMVDVIDEQGNMVYLSLSFNDLLEMQQKITSDPSVKKALDIFASGGLEALHLYVSKVTVPYDWFDRDSLVRGMYLVNVVQWHAKQSLGKFSSQDLFVPHKAWYVFFKEYALKHHVKAHIQVGGFRRRFKNIIFSRLNRERIKWLIGAFNRFLLSFKGDAKTSFLNPFDARPKLMVDFSGHLNLEEPQLHSDVFFRHNNPELDETILLAFKIARDKLDDNRLDIINKHKMSAVVINHAASQLNGDFYFQHWPRTQAMDSHLRGLLNTITTHADHPWIKEQIEDIVLQVNYWQDLFSRTSTKVFITWYKYDGVHALQAQALRQVGGIMTMYQRAFEEFVSPELAICSDVSFSFSRLSIDVGRQSGSRVPYDVITGYGGDYRQEYLKPYAQELRTQLQAQGAKHILAYFDEGSGADSRWHTAHEFMRVNYEFLLRKVIDNPWLGLIIKPKVSKSLKSRLGEVKELLDRAESTGRCVVLEGGIGTKSHPPSIAAMAADVAIHGHLCAATAGVEAVLAGVPTLLMDRESCPMSRLYGLGVGKVVFNQWEHLWNVCCDHWKSPRGIEGFGDWSSMMEELDPFRDGKAAYRTGTYLQWLMDGYKKNLKREDILEQAAERYATQWGKDKIIRTGAKG